MELDKVAEQRDRAMGVLSGKLGNTTLARLWEMSRFTTRPDGFKTRTLPDGGSPGSDETSSTEAAALYGMPDGSPWLPEHTPDRLKAKPDRWDDPRRFKADPLGQAIAEVVQKVGWIAEKAGEIEETLRFIATAGDVRSDTKECERCAGTGLVDDKRCEVCQGSTRVRKNSVPLCYRCNTMILGKVTRIHGQPYHDGAEYDPVTGAKLHPDCYQQENRRLRKLDGLPDRGDPDEPLIDTAPDVGPPSEVQFDPLGLDSLTGGGRRAGAQPAVATWAPELRETCDQGHRCCKAFAATAQVHEHFYPPATCPTCSQALLIDAYDGQATAAHSH